MFCYFFLFFEANDQGIIDQLPAVFQSMFS